MLHDFKCRKSEEVINKVLAEGIRHYKETEEGRGEMSDIVEKYGDEREKQGEKRGEKRGEKKSNLRAVINLMDTMKLSVEQALDALKIQGKERDSIIKAVQG